MSNLINKQISWPVKQGKLFEIEVDSDSHSSFVMAQISRYCPAVTLRATTVQWTWSSTCAWLLAPFILPPYDLNKAALSRINRKKMLTVHFDLLIVFVQLRISQFLRDQSRLDVCCLSSKQQTQMWWSWNSCGRGEIWFDRFHPRITAGRQRTWKLCIVCDEKATHLSPCLNLWVLQYTLLWIILHEVKKNKNPSEQCSNSEDSDCSPQKWTS